MTRINFKNIQIRDATAADAPILANAERSITATPGRMVSYPEELRDEDFLSKIEFLNAHPRGRYIVARVDGSIAGHALLEPLHRAAIAHVVSLTLAVHEGWQERGIGENLLGHLIDWATTTPGIEKIELNVRSENQRAIALYRKLGFSEEGRLQRRIKLSETQYLDDILMALFVKPHQ